jgi:hypothetical protein
VKVDTLGEVTVGSDELTVCVRADEALAGNVASAL